MTAPLPAKAVVASDRDDTSDVSSELLEEAADHLRNAISSLRASKTSIARARHRLPRCGTDLELQLQPPKLYDVEKALIRLARRIEGRLAQRQEPAP